jgi:hypothetical protein
VVKRDIDGEEPYVSATLRDFTRDIEHGGEEGEGNDNDTRLRVCENRIILGT